MSELETEFTDHATRVKQLTVRPSDEILLELYSLYKQSTIGNCNTPQPWFYEIENQSKWNAWNARKDQTKEECMRLYINKVKELINNN
jgi:diazepam-binding inhibitor (GABA receptor modulating acyl-CoA-binding protein)